MMWDKVSMPYPHLKILIISILIFHFILGFSTKYFLKTDTDFKPFPFFSWSLFSKVPEDVEVLHTLRILSLNGKKLDRPIFFADAEFLFAVDKNSPRAWYNLFQDLAYALESGGEKEVEQIRKSIERHILVESIEYEVVEVRFRPINFYKNREVIELKHYGTFQVSN